MQVLEIDLAKMYETECSQNSYYNYIKVTKPEHKNSSPARPVTKDGKLLCPPSSSADVTPLNGLLICIFL